MMKKYYLTLTLIGIAFAVNDNVGTSVANFLKIQAGGRAASMGGAFCAQVNDASALYLNPAGMSQITKTEFMFNHTDWILDLDHTFIGLIIPLGKNGNFGLSVNHLNIGEMEETTEFADIILPDLHHLERLVPFVYNNIGSGEGCITNYGAKPVVHPPFEHPFEGEYVDVMQIFLELARRAGFLEDFYEAFNLIAGLKDENRLDLDREYTYPEIVDRFLKNELGPDNGLEWFMEDGLWTEDKAVEDKYPRPFVTPRCHIYYEFMKRAGEDVQHVTEELGIPWDTQDYQVLPDWKPGPSYKRQPPHDLIVINTKVPNHALSHTHRNPLLQSLSARHNDLRTVWINTRTAAERGIADGDWFVIETFEGRQQRAIANVTELVHPEVLATQGCGGGWMDPATNQEVNFNALLAIDEDHIDFVTGALDSAVPARAFKAE